MNNKIIAAVVSASVVMCAGAFCQSENVSNVISTPICASAEETELISINDFQISGLLTSYTYTGSAQTPDFTLSNNGISLVKDKDYTVTLKNNISVGTATITIDGIGEYCGSIEKTFTIKPADFTKSTVSAIADKTYTGDAIKPDVIVKWNSVTLKNGTDYTVTYSNNTKVGTATVKIVGKGSYNGTVTKTFKISAALISKTTVTGISSTYNYRGKAIKPNPTLKLGTKKLVKGTDYTIAYKNNLNSGTATVIITGKGQLTGTVKKTFKIKARSVSQCKLNGLIKYYKYTGKSRTPHFTLTIGSLKFTKGKDYTVSYSNNVNLGTATVTIKGKGNLSGTVKKTFKIVQKGWKTVNGNKYYYINGKKATGVTKAGKHTYYFSSDGIMQYGWQKIDDNYYFFSRVTGIRIGNKSVDGISINKNATVEKTQYNVSKIDTMIYAHKLMNEITNPTDSMETKRLKCFKWVFQFPYHRFRPIANIYTQKGWEITFANDIFKFKSGCCVSESAAVAFLFHECGYKTVYVCHDTGHAWVEVNKHIFDPLFAEGRDFDSNYNISLSTGYRSNPVQRRKI